MAIGKGWGGLLTFSQLLKPRNMQFYALTNFVYPSILVHRKMNCQESLSNWNRTLSKNIKIQSLVMSYDICETKC